MDGSQAGHSDEAELELVVVDELDSHSPQVEALDVVVL